LKNLYVKLSLNLRAILLKVLTQPQATNLDSAVTSANHTVINKIDTIEAVNNVIALQNGLERNELAADTSNLGKSSENILFTVPYRCTLNRDSLKAEMRKVVLEIDTIPKGLQLIVQENIKDTVQLQPPVFLKSLFTHHSLIPKNFEPKPKIAQDQNWMVMILVFVLFLVAILRVYYQRKFTLFINAFFSKRFSNQIIREENALTQSTSVILSIVFLISISLFFYLVSLHFHHQLIGANELQKFGVIILACVVFYFLKFLTNKLGGYLFKVYKETDEYIFNQFLVLQIMGLLLVALCILLSYNTNINKEFIIYTGFITLGIGFIVRMIKSFGIANTNTYSPVYIFLYLCTLEILPLIIIVKLIVR